MAHDVTNRRQPHVGDRVNSGHVRRNCKTVLMTDAVEKVFFSSDLARLIQEQAPSRNVD